MSSSTPKKLRFAALIRVSTEKQERKGESLRTQASQIMRAVEVLGGKIVQQYAGQEHATAGWEREQLTKLLDDAVKPSHPFDAVIVADATRWSRDNVASDTGLEKLRDAKVRFFVLGTEYDLFNPEARLFLRMTATIGAYHAHNQKKKSLENRIERARRGIPASGRLPFGRTWDKEAGWGVDPAKKAMVEDVAERYLAGESLPKLAKEYGINHSGLCRLLRDRCGDTWKAEFRAAELNIDETVTMDVPRLLPEPTIKAVRHRLKANSTYLHKPPKSIHDYLLSGRIFCAECGRALSGQAVKDGPRHHLYYRHAKDDKARECPVRPFPFVPARKIEEAVVRDLFDMFGNPAAIERAVKAAVPDCDKAIKQRERLAKELAKLDQTRNRLLDLIERDALTLEQAEKKLRDLRDREKGLRAELERIAATLADLPDEEVIRCHVDKIGESIFVFDDAGNTYAGGNDVMSFILMTGQERRTLISSVLGSPMPDGKPSGVYVTPERLTGPKRFHFSIEGRLIWRVVPRTIP